MTLASMFLEAPLTRALVGMPFDVADARRLGRPGEIEELVTRFERRVAEARQASVVVTDLIGRLRSGTEASSAAERGAAVEVLLAAERGIDDIRRQLLAKAAENEAAAASDAPHLLPFFQRMTALIDEELVTYLDAARDVRWELLALQAEGEPAAEGEILSSPADIDRFFESLSRAS